MEFDREEINKVSTDIIESFMMQSADNDYNDANRAVKYTIARFLQSFNEGVWGTSLISSYELTSKIKSALEDCLDEVNRANASIISSTETVQ